MIRNRLKVFSIGAFACTLPLSSCLISCNNFEPEPIENKIILPANLSVQTTISQQNETIGRIYGFKFEGSLDFDKLRVFQSLDITSGIVTIDIDDWDDFNKSFSIYIYTKDVQPNVYTGNIGFTYDGKDIQVEGQTNIEYTILKHTYIFNPDNLSCESQLDENGNADFLFSNFSYTGIDDITKLSVKTDYSLAEAVFTTNIEALDNNKFNVNVHVENALPRTLSSLFTFYYDGELLTDTPDNEFTIKCLEHTAIFEPEVKTLRVVNDSNGKTNILFSGFSYSGLDPYKLNVNTSFETSLEHSSFSCKIININPYFKMFDVQIIMTGVKHYENINGSFTFTWDEQVWETSSDFVVNVDTSINVSLLKFSVDGDGRLCLDGFIDNDPPIEQFDTLLIPSYVQVISNSAFAGSTIGKLDFEENCSLELIDDAAFYQCYFLETVNIPASVRSIGMSAFLNDVNIKSIAFEEGAMPLTIQKDAFNGLADLTGKVTLPKRLKKVESNLFSGSQVEKIYIPSTLEEVSERSFAGMGYLHTIYLNDNVDFLPSWMVEYDKGNNVFSNAGHASQEENKIVYVPNSEEIDIQDAKNVLFNSLGLPTDLNWQVIKK